MRLVGIIVKFPKVKIRNWFLIKKAIKYVLLLSLTKGLKGNALKSYLQNLDVTVKGAKVNYKNILKARSIFEKEGKLGLLQPFYGERGVKICF